MNRIDDREVVKKILTGEVEAYGLLFEKYGLMVRAMAVARLRDVDAAREVVQDVFLRAYEHLGSISHPVPHLGGVLQNLTIEVCRERLRDRPAKAWILKVTAEKAERAGPGLDLEAVLGELPRSQAAMILAEQAVGIPVQYEVPFLLRFLEGLSYPDIAKVLDVPISEVEGLVDRGRR
ncbi:MAG: hypothetical protein GY704_04430, partial [Phycisphaeraceae bacterium]|nr:hypothetical protein [Phycisphaeraceae bacterium]